MNKQAIITVLITALTFVSCRPTARQTVADVAQPTSPDLPYRAFG